MRCSPRSLRCRRSSGSRWSPSTSPDSPTRRRRDVLGHARGDDRVATVPRPRRAWRRRCGKFRPPSGVFDDDGRGTRRARRRNARARAARCRVAPGRGRPGTDGGGGPPARGARVDPRHGAGTRVRRATRERAGDGSRRRRARARRHGRAGRSRSPVRSPARPRRRWPSAVLLGGDDAAGPSVAEAARVALAPAVRAPGDATRTATVDGIAYPYWADSTGWRAVGARHDVFAAGPSAPSSTPAQISGSATPSSPALRSPSTAAGPSHATGCGCASCGPADATIVTWLRAGHTCVLAARHIDPEVLLRLATWRA